MPTNQKNQKTKKSKTKNQKKQLKTRFMELFNTADRPGVAICPEDRVTNGLWNFLWWPGEWPVFESQSRIQSSVL
ncbi:MAG: hypothetical protein ACLPY5_11325, partial [Candidatus Bathyarchaeia archaeon]